MSPLNIYTTKPNNITAENLNPRNYDPIYLFVKEKLKEHPTLREFLKSDVYGGSTPPYYLFRKDYESSIPFVKTSAISKDFINLNDLHFIYPKFHYQNIRRSITKPYDVIFSMTGKFMGKAALCPPTIPEINMSQNSVVLKTQAPEHSAFLTIFLNSVINKRQIFGLYSITKQKYINQGKIAKLRVIKYSNDCEPDLVDYLEGIKEYYTSVHNIRGVVTSFNVALGFDSHCFDKTYSFTTNPSLLNKSILTPQYYRTDAHFEISSFSTDEKERKLKEFDIHKGNEIGSKNYVFDGIPYIRTSNFMNYGADYQPNYYCSNAICSELDQDLKIGDLIFTKDGTIGEIAVLDESAKIVICSGIVRVRPTDEKTKYWIFLLLSSDYGKACFNRWTVIASTMTHLRKDFFSDIAIPTLQPEVEDNYVNKLLLAFKNKKKAFCKIEAAKENILKRWYDYIE